MNLVFMRHGEAVDNVKQIISDKEIYWSTLTPIGESEVENTLISLHGLQIDKIYVSPMPRTIQTANLVRKVYKDVEYIIDNRIKEIDHGKYSGQANNQDLDQTRERQSMGNYFIRFGQYGENKMDIELRLSEFLMDVCASNIQSNTILIISHGSITSFMKRILGIKTPHLKTGKAEAYENVDFRLVFKYYKHLKNILKEESQRRIKIVQSLNLNNELKRTLIKMCKKEVNNIEFDNNVFENYIDGLGTKQLVQRQTSRFDDGVILICFYNDFENFAKKWMEHYINIGVKNFVLVNNDSRDTSTAIVNLYKNIINLDLWDINDSYNCYKMCGWRQKLIDFYGTRTYLFVDSDELYVFKKYKDRDINNFIEKSKCDCIKSLMIDVYSKNGIEDVDLDNYEYADKNAYRMSNNNCYGERYYGGVRSRVFNIKPSLQKISVLRYTGNEILINDHFYYPWKLNKTACLNAFLLHYKFLPGDLIKYRQFANDGRHWNNSREYKEYVKILDMNIKNFYDKEHSALVDDVINAIK